MARCFDQPLLLEPFEGSDHARVLLRLIHGVIAEMEFEDVVVTDARLLQAGLDELVVLLLVDAAARVVPVHAVHDALEVIRLPRLALEGGRERVGVPPLGLVPVVDPGVHRPGDDLLRPVGRADQPADLEAGAAVSPLGHLVGGGFLIRRRQRQFGDAGRDHARRPEPHHVPARKVLRAIRHGRPPFHLEIEREKRLGPRDDVSLPSERRRSTAQSAARKGTFPNRIINMINILIIF